MAVLESRRIETFDELVGRGLSTLEALGVWLFERGGYVQLRPSVRGLVVCFVYTPWHALAVPASSFERAISAACRRVDELLERSADTGPEGAKEFARELIPEGTQIDLHEGLSSEEEP